MQSAAQQSCLPAADFPLIMGVVNLTDDSFHRASCHASIDNAVKHAQQLLEQGADIIDLGAESTNPNTHPVTDKQQQLERLIPVIQRLRSHSDCLISIDTSQPQVMRETIAAGANWINDVRALREPGALAAVAELQVPVILMHMLYPYGVPRQCEKDAYQGNVVAAIKQFLQQRIEACLQAGIAAKHIMIDPGFGGGSFGKSTAQNLQLAKQLNQLTALDYPLVIGVSRKTFIGDILQQSAEQRLYGSLALLPGFIQQGARVLRVHDVAATRDMVILLKAVELSA